MIFVALASSRLFDSRCLFFQCEFLLQGLRNEDAALARRDPFE